MCKGVGESQPGLTLRAGDVIEQQETLTILTLSALSHHMASKVPDAAKIKIVACIDGAHS